MTAHSEIVVIGLRRYASQLLLQDCDDDALASYLKANGNCVSKVLGTGLYEGRLDPHGGRGSPIYRRPHSWLVGRERYRPSSRCKAKIAETDCIKLPWAGFNDLITTKIWPVETESSDSAAKMHKARS